MTNKPNKNSPESPTIESKPVKTKPKLTRRDKRKFAEEYINTDRNASLAYQRIRPEVTEGSAKVRGNKMLEDVIVKAEIQGILDELGITKRYILEGYKTAIESGLAKKATNKDALTGLKELAKLSGMEEKPDYGTLERSDLELLSHQELLTRLDQIGQQVKQLKVEGAIEGKIIDP